MSKEKNYDYTANQRRKKREERIRDAGLSYLKVVMHRDDAEEVREYARSLFEKRGIKFWILLYPVRAYGYNISTN